MSTYHNVWQRKGAAPFVGTNGHKSTEAARNAVYAHKLLCPKLKLVGRVRITWKPGHEPRR